MVLLALFQSYGPWAWMVLGLVLLALELAVPGGYFLWLGAAGIVTGLVAFTGAVSWPWEAALFGVLAVLIVVVWTMVTRNRKHVTDQPFLNDRASRYVGRESILAEPIRDGAGRLTLDDTIWRVSGPDLAAGEKVRVVGTDGAVLKVTAA